MDLAKERTAEDQAISKTVGYIFNLINISLIGYLVWRGLIVSNDTLIEEFKTLRNSFYYSYSILLVVAGASILFRSLVKPGTLNQAGLVGATLPHIIFSLVLTTFSYSIAGLITSLLKFILPL